MNPLRARLAELVTAASDGVVSVREADTHAVPFHHLGVTSLAQLRLIDAVEREFGVEIEVWEEAALESLEALEHHLAARGVRT